MPHDCRINRRFDPGVRDHRSGALHAKQAKHLIDLRNGKLVWQSTVVEAG
jgi:hypothetical protein